jgi:hypothetical protein
MKKQAHFSLEQLLKQYLQTWSTDSFFNPEQGFNLIVYTFQAMLSTIEQEISSVVPHISIISLANIDKRASF